MSTENIDYNAIMIDHMFQFVGLCDIEGRLLTANNSALQAAELTSKDVIGKYIWETYWWDVDQATIDTIKQSVLIANQDQIFCQEMFINAPVKKENRLMCIMFIMRPIKIDGKIAYLLPEAVNIDDRKKSEMELVRENNQNMELMASKDQFFTFITHELKTPLNGIIGINDLVTHDINNNKFDKVLFHNELIRKAATNMLDLIMQVLEFSLFETNNYKLNPTTVNLKQFIENALNVHKILAIRKGLSFFHEIDNRKIKIDTNIILNIVNNLVNNAIKYTQIGHVKLKMFINDNEMVIKVNDSGVGIDSNFQSELFDIFKRSDRTKQNSGHGIGLALVKKSVDLYHGKIL